MTKAANDSQLQTGALRSRALIALRNEIEDHEARSVADGDGRYWFVSDSHEGSETGSELYFEFPTSADGTPSTLSIPFELYSAGRALFSGVLETSARVGAESLSPLGCWERTCVDFDDGAYAFFERSIPVTGGRLFSRRILLAYHESLALLVDELVPNPSERATPAPRALMSRLTLAEDARASQDADAREVSLVDATAEPESTVARLFPLALPEWRADLSRGDFKLTRNAESLELELLSSAACLVSPLVIDLNPYRAARECAWKPLTVGERREVAARDAAVGYKLQLGAEQYVLYVSTSIEPAIRSILSRNLLSDFMFGKFLPTSGVRPIVDVEVLEE